MPVSVYCFRIYYSRMWLRIHNYSKYYADEVKVQLDNGILATDVKVDVKLSTLKPMHAKWLMELYDKMQSKSNMIIKGFKKAGITDAISMDYLLCEDPFESDCDD